MISENERQEKRLQGLIEQSLSQLQALETDKEVLLREKTSREVEIEDL